MQYVNTEYCNSVTPKVNDRGEEETMFCNSFLHLGKEPQTISPTGLRINNHCAGEGQQQLNSQSVSQSALSNTGP
jgi:hypothetical protein